MTPRRRSTTMRMPRLSDSSRRSTTPSILRSLTSWEIFFTRTDLFTPYGISVMTRDLEFLFLSSISTRPRIFTVPRPVWYASRRPLPVKTMPLVGKSGPFTTSISSLTVVSGLSISMVTASHSSPRLCVGMLVAMPTAMPDEPLSKRLGTFDGRMDGSSREPS